MDLTLFIKVGGIILLLGFSAFFSGSEAAFFSLRRWKVERLKSTGKGGFYMSELLADPRGLLVTLLIGNEMANVTASNLAAIIRRDYFSVFGASGVMLAMLIMTTVLFFIGDIIPKSIAVYLPDQWGTLASFPMKFIYRWLAPVRKILKRIMNLIDRIFLKTASMESRGVSIPELRSLVQESAGERILSLEEVRIINSIFDLGTLAVKTVMVPRTEMIFIKEDMDIKEAVTLAGKTKFSRFPVISQNEDDIKGIVYSKDLLSAYYHLQEASHVKDIVKPALFVPETKKAYELLREFQVKQIHIAIVLDEYGGTAGLVTLDDLLSEMVGDMVDDHRRTSYRFKKISEHLFIIDGNLSLQDFNELSGENLEDPDVETIAGYVIKRLGRIPREGDEIRDMNFEFRILKMAKRRVTEIRARRINPST